MDDLTFHDTHLEDTAPPEPPVDPWADDPGGHTVTAFGDPGDPAATDGVPDQPDTAEDVPVDPSSPTLHGTPDPNGTYHLWQGSTNGTCAPTAIAMVLAHAQGEPAESSSPVVGRAMEMGLITLDPSDPQDAASGGWSGMTTQGMVDLLESYGLDAQVRHGGVDDLAAQLDAGGTVITNVDADELWTGVSDDAQDGGQDSNHAVVVTGIDTGAGVVYLDDPAYADGAYAVPIETFEQAWDDSGHEMITTEVPPPDGTDAPPAPGPTLLPFGLSLDDLRP